MKSVLVATNTAARKIVLATVGPAHAILTDLVNLAIHASLVSLANLASLADRPDLRVTRFVVRRKRNQRKKIPAKNVTTENTKEKVAGDKIKKTKSGRTVAVRPF